MNQVKLDLLAKGGEIYYMDTDSIVTNIPLDNSMIGNDIGQFKLEHKVDRGYFISGKTYCLVTGIGSKVEVIIKAKGVKSSSLTEEDFIDLYNNKDINTALKIQSKMDFSLGSVDLITNTEVRLKHPSYKKRVKLYTDKSI